jgi:hypothetical protein
MAGVLQLMVASGQSLSVSVSPSTGDATLGNGVAYSMGFTATAVGGVGSKTYLWTFVSNPFSFSYSGGTTSPTATITRAGLTDVERGYTARITVTDAAGTVATADVPATVTWGTP